MQEAADDLAAYGLKPPHATIVILKGRTESDLATVFIGGRNPTSTAVYASKEGSSEVVLLGYSARSTMKNCCLRQPPAPPPAQTAAQQQPQQQRLPAMNLLPPPLSKHLLQVMTSQASQEERAADQVPAGEEHSAASVSQSVSQSTNQAAGNSAQDTLEQG